MTPYEVVQQYFNGLRNLSTLFEPGELCPPLYLIGRSTRRILFVLGALVVAASLALVAGSATRSAEIHSTHKVAIQATASGITQISLNTNDIVYDAARNRIYASVPNTGSVVSINPSTGSIGSPLTSGSSPNRMALSDDNRYLYVSLEGSFNVRRLDLQSPGSFLEFSFGDGRLGPLHAGDLEVLPGQPESVAISLRDGGIGNVAVAVFDNGTQRPNTSPPNPPNDVLEFGANASTPFGYNSTNSEFGLHKLAVDANGVSHVGTLSNVLRSDAEMKFDGGRLYGTQAPSSIRNLSLLQAVSAYQGLATQLNLTSLTIAFTSFPRLLPILNLSCGLTILRPFFRLVM